MPEDSTADVMAEKEPGKPRRESAAGSTSYRCRPAFLRRRIYLVYKLFIKSGLYTFIRFDSYQVLVETPVRVVTVISHTAAGEQSLKVELRAGRGGRTELVVSGLSAAEQVRDLLSFISF